MSAASGPGLRSGVDIVSVQRVQDVYERFGQRFLRRIYTEDEARYCLARGASAIESLAARFAAKEAVVKALATTSLVVYRDIEVVSHDGPCTLSLRGSAAAAAANAGLREFTVSLSHEREYAIAFVTASGGTNVA